MKSEALYIAVLLAPWVVVIAAVLFYRHRAKRNMLDDTAGDRDDKR